MSNIWEFVGRLHPLVVHLPIGVLLLLAVVEGLGAWRETLKPTAGVRLTIVAVAVVSALMAAGFGWVLGEHGSYDATLLERHRLLGLATLGLAVLLLLVRHRSRIYTVVLTVAVVVLGWTGHDGGSLTHGRDYLTSVMPSPWREWFGGEAPVEDAPRELAQVHVFNHMIQPLLAAKCVSCHGESKSEGDLRLDSFAAIVAGGKTGAVLHPGNPGESLLMQRLFLPLAAKKHMPPAGKPQPTEGELALLDWWIESGASDAMDWATAVPDPAMAEWVARQLGLPLPPVPDREEMLAAGNALEQQWGITVRPLSAEGPWLEVNARLAGGAFGDAELAALEPIAGAIHRLDLGGTAVTDAGLGGLAGMTELRQLRLDRTAISDAGLARLAGLRRLESLNLHTTAVTDAGIGKLEHLPRLRRLFVWQTEVTKAATTALANKLEDRRKLTRYREELNTLERLIVSETFVPDFGFEPVSLPTSAPLEEGEDGN